MRFILQLFSVNIPSIDSLGLADKNRLLDLYSQLSGLSTTAGVGFFGRTEKLEPIHSVDQLVKEFRKGSSGNISFADVDSPDGAAPGLHWKVGIRKALVTVTLECERAAEEAVRLAEELVALNNILLSFIREGGIEVPFSFVRTPGVSFKHTRPPRFLREIVEDSIVDVVHSDARQREGRQEVVNQLWEMDSHLPAERTLKDRFLVVQWSNLTSETPHAALARRYSWYVEHGNFSIDSSYNSAGDKEFALWNSKATQQLTGYSASNRKAVKAVVFDKPEDVVDILEELRQILSAGATVEGYPVREITLILPSRESAVELQPLAERYGLSVVYAADDKRLWNPFPPE